MMRMNREPNNPLYQKEWNVSLPESRSQLIQEKGRPTAHLDYMLSRGAMVGVVPNVDERWQRLNNYYLICIKDVDNRIVEILDELDNLGIADNTIVIFTADHGELAAATDALRVVALYNYNMLAYLDVAFFTNINKFFAEGGKPEEIANQGF
ncbi:sulfatase-like hydrolase/transferase [Photobacterium indicum]|uniref:sulfatase-like hydrolase/transferase n=1 Tax=Photobacterium indicum TaxID=81447 RepID=UPI003D13D318